ncbi:polyketide cyclase/dehydrase/lipid transport protein [Thermosporothrix hazakensis]|jgi:ribosome-associated toxin RatA of RatAB toxin-antitoxin module|uniref:Polyketide cyclase/dehydrase/lipid transport protein n=1 Tax=Thermosporothrix hazakensis TaxID=644383 RepID=A0A326U3W5_THEHA|nr:SRPBCC family protein [Thermosporothrix hazakensis]PZW26355.1 polyketide cyclase/dehydrase/lipid transport protein [Thermosporothrix hazakensis]GCE48694.1 hypothetical protein KTH_35630 [Thermosporothrix hazakensis]
MVEHSASVVVKAPVEQVYQLFTHFNDFPKFMRFVKEVTYYDEQRSHWVVQVVTTHEWDAVNEDWIPNRQVGWRSTRGLRNSGKVKFRPMGTNRTEVAVYISYEPPTGPLGKLGEALGVNSYFESVLQTDLSNFARMVEEAPPGALDPMSSHYLFHEESAFSRGVITHRQREAMAHDPMMTPEALEKRLQQIEQERQEKERAAQQQQEFLRRQLEEKQRAWEALQAQLAEARRRQEQITATLASEPLESYAPHPVYSTLGGRSAAMDRVALGDRDALRPRYALSQQDPMMARLPKKERDPAQPSVEELAVESPWWLSIRGPSDVCFLGSGEEGMSQEAR